MSERDDTRAFVVARGHLGYQAPYEDRVTPDTVYDLASLTKALVTTSLTMMAVGEGTLGLDEPLVVAPPGGAETVPAAFREITVRQVLTHETGLPAHLPYHDKVLGESAGNCTGDNDPTISPPMGGRGFLSWC